MAPYSLSFLWPVGTKQPTIATLERLFGRPKLGRTRIAHTAERHDLWPEYLEYLRAMGCAATCWYDRITMEWVLDISMAPDVADLFAKPTRPNCPNCGAPKLVSLCDYCRTLS